MNFPTFVAGRRRTNGTCATRPDRDDGRREDHETWGFWGRTQTLDSVISLIGPNMISSFHLLYLVFHFFFFLRCPPCLDIDVCVSLSFLRDATSGLRLSAQQLPLISGLPLRPCHRRRLAPASGVASSLPRTLSGSVARVCVGCICIRIWLKHINQLECLS